MKALIIFILFCQSAVAQYGFLTQKEYENKLRLDTICGIVVYVDRIIIVSEGIRIDTIKSIYGPVECPDEKAGTYYGCMVLHYGWTDIRTGYRYESYGEAIENKNIIHFIPK